MPVNLDGSITTRSLLGEKLDPLQLPMELMDRIVKSIQEVLARAVIAETGSEHIHLFIFVPVNYSTMGRTWGFFRIERINAGDNNASPSHAVDLYLYPEAG